MVVLPQDRGRLFLYHSNWNEILGHVVHCLCAIYALVYILQSSRPDIIIAIIFLSSSSAILPNVGSLKLRIYLIDQNSTCDLDTIQDPIIWIL
jgi:hypothetical protein